MIRIRALAIALPLLTAAGAALACTAVDMIAADKSVVAGRTMEWAFDMKWTLVSQPKGTALSLTAPKSTGLPAKTVVTKYPVVGVSAGIIPGGALLDGQNSEGLSMSGNFLPGFTQYQTVTPQDKEYQSILTFGSWALGNFASVAELKQALSAMKVWADELKIHDNIMHVLTNAPTYDWHVNNVRNYLNLSPVGVQQRQLGTVNVTEIGQGGGFIGLPADYTPPSRFLRATALRHTVTPPKTADEAVQAVAHVLNNVDIPVGVAESRTPDGTLVSDYTQWIVVKDLTNNVLKIADYNNRMNYLTVDLNAVFADGKPMAKLVNDLPYPKAVAGSEAFRPETNAAAAQ
jgi:penicillin V acylase-like amidase (Ntn superfamily)